MAVLFSKIVKAPYDVEGTDLQGNPKTSRFAVVQLKQKSGMLSTTVNAGIFLDTKGGVAEADLNLAKENDVFDPKGNIVTQYIPEGYEIDGRVVNSITMYVSQYSSLVQELIKRKIPVTALEEVIAE